MNSFLFICLIFVGLSVAAVNVTKSTYPHKFHHSEEREIELITESSFVERNPLPAKYQKYEPNARAFLARYNSKSGIELAAIIIIDANKIPYNSGFDIPFKDCLDIRMTVKDNNNGGQTTHFGRNDFVDWTFTSPGGLDFSQDIVNQYHGSGGTGYWGQGEGTGDFNLFPRTQSDKVPWGIDWYALYYGGYWLYLDSFQFYGSINKEWSYPCQKIDSPVNPIGSEVSQCVLPSIVDDTVACYDYNELFDKHTAIEVKRIFCVVMECDTIDRQSCVKVHDPFKSCKWVEEDRQVCIHRGDNVCKGKDFDKCVRLYDIHMKTNICGDSVSTIAVPASIENVGGKKNLINCQKNYDQKNKNFN